MGALGDDPAVFHHDDAVRLQNGGEAMGDDDGGAPDHELLQRLLHQLLRFGIERAGRFIEQQQRRIAQDGARDSDALALAAGQPHALLAEEAVEAVGQLLDELARGGGLGGGEHLGISRLGAAVANIGPGIGAEDHRILRHQAHAGTHRLRVGPRHVDTVEQNAAGLRIVKAQQQLEHRGLAGARRADERDGFARRDLEIEIGERRAIGARRIAEGDALEGDGAAAALRR